MPSLRRRMTDQTLPRDHCRPRPAAGRRRGAAARSPTCGTSCAGSACGRRASASRSAGSCSAKGDRHITAEMLFDEAARARIPVSLATVYNTLHQFTEAGLLRQLAVDGSKAYFDTNPTEHHHFFIEGEDALVDVPGEAIAVGELPAPPEGMEIAGVEVIVRAARTTLQWAASAEPLLDLLVRDRRPRAVLADVAVEVARRSAARTMTRHQAPLHCLTLAMTPGCSLASTSARSSARSWSGDRRRIALGPRRDERRAPAGQERVQHPALGALRVADAPPSLVLGGDLDRQAGALEHPGRPMVLGRPLAQVHPVRLEADVPRNRQARALPAARAPPARRAGR